MKDFVIGDLVEWIAPGLNELMFLIVNVHMMPPPKNPAGEGDFVCYRAFILKDSLEPKCVGTVCNLVFNENQMRYLHRIDEKPFLVVDID